MNFSSLLFSSSLACLCTFMGSRRVGISTYFFKTLSTEASFFSTIQGVDTERLTSGPLNRPVVMPNWSNIKDVMNEWILIRLFRQRSRCHKSICIRLRTTYKSHNKKMSLLFIFCFCSYWKIQGKHMQSDAVSCSVNAAAYSDGAEGFTVAGTLWSEWKPLELNERVCLWRATCKLLSFLSFCCLKCPNLAAIVWSERSWKCRDVCINFLNVNHVCFPPERVVLKNRTLCSVRISTVCFKVHDRLLFNL